MVTALKSRRALRVSLLILIGGVLLAIALTLIDVNRGPRDRTWAHVQDKGVLTIAVDPSIPPFGSFDSASQPIGLDVDLGREIAQRLGVSARFTVLNFDGIYDALVLGHTDIVIAALRVDPLRLDIARYSDPYFDAGQVIVSSDGYQTGDDLSGRRVGVEFASEADLSLRQDAAITIERYFTAGEALDALQSDEIDAAVVDHVSAELYLSAHPASGLSLSAQTLVPDPYVIAVRQPAWRLHRAIQQALDDMQADGTLDALIARWFEAENISTQK